MMVFTAKVWAESWYIYPSSNNDGEETIDLMFLEKKVSFELDGDHLSVTLGGNPHTSYHTAGKIECKFSINCIHVGSETLDTELSKC